VDSSPIIELRNVTKHFGATRAVNGVSLAIWPGEVHALLGENGAGKSTLINILSGELTPDAGELYYGSKLVRLGGPWDAVGRGTSVVHQELALCPNLTAAQNIALPAIARTGVLALLPDQKVEAKRWLERLGMPDLRIDIPIRWLTLGQQQLVEIAKALAMQVRVLILDEPNSALSFAESEHLFSTIRQLKSEGVGIVYVSHRLEEALALADRITVLRDGSVVETGERVHYTIPDLIRKMVGREVDHLFHREPLSEPEQTLALSVCDLCDDKELENINFSVRSGEIYGIAGLPGSGKDELVDCLSGVRKCTGDVRLAGRSLRLGSPSELVARGLVLVPADRRGAGIFPVLSIIDNIAAANLKRVTRFGILLRGTMNSLAATYLSRMRLKASSVEQRAGTLSGGNQQKVVLARGLGTNPQVLLVHEPTRGIDVGAKAEIYRILNQLAAKGLAIIIVSSELPELIGQCDRIAVMHSGNLAGEFKRTEFNQERILECAMGRNHEHASC